MSEVYVDRILKKKKGFKTAKLRVFGGTFLIFMHTQQFINNVLYLLLYMVISVDRYAL